MHGLASNAQRPAQSREGDVQCLMSGIGSADEENDASDVAAITGVGEKGAHGSGLRRLGRFAEHFFVVEGLQLPVVARKHVGHIAARNFAERRLRDSRLLGNLRLSEPVANQCANEVFCFHVGHIPSRLLCQSYRNMQARLNGEMPRSTEDTLATRLRMARKLRGMSQEQLAVKSGVKQSDISKLETGKSFATSGIARLAEALNAQARWLELGEGRRPTQFDAAFDYSPPPPAPPRDFADRHEVSDSDWALLMEMKEVMAVPKLAAEIEKVRQEFAVYNQIAAGIAERQVRERIEDARRRGGMVDLSVLTDDRKVVPAKKTGGAK